MFIEEPTKVTYNVFIKMLRAEAQDCRNKGQETEAKHLDNIADLMIKRYLVKREENA